MRPPSRASTDPEAQAATSTTRVVDGPGVDTFRGRSRLERAVLPYLREQTLWPVLTAVLVHVIALVAPLIVFSIRDRSGWAFSGCVVMLAGTGVAIAFEVHDRRRAGKVTALLALVWLLCAAGAYGSVSLGLL